MWILGRVALGGAVFCVASGLYFHHRIQEDFRQTGYYKKSFVILRRNEAAINLLGEPIKAGKLDLGNDEDNRADGLTARLRVPVWGKKSSGELYLWASRTVLRGEWTVDRMELAIKKEKDKRLLVYDAGRSEENVEKDIEKLGVKR